MKSNLVKNICCIGAGYVGGPTMSVIALNCPELIINVVDLDYKKIDAWNSKDFSKLPVFEPGLEEILKKCRDKNLFFSIDVEANIRKADIIFISVNTPTKEVGVGKGYASDLKWIESSARQISKFAQNHTIVVEKSTLPVKTAETIKKILDFSQESSDSQDKKSFSIISNPEFLAEGTAINDLQNPDRVLIGGEDKESIEKIFDIYKNWVNPEKIITTNLWSSELSKLVANAFLAQRISSINSISALCESTGANINEVALAIGTDTRLGKKFLKPGPGFGGSCFKKDILNLVYLCKYYGLSEVSEYWEQIVKINSWQQERISSIVIRSLFGTLANKRLAIYGFAFKANTNDTRESPSITVSKNLLKEGVELNFYDPRVEKDQILREFVGEEYNEKIFVCESALSAAKGTDAVIVLTEWDEFKFLEWEKIYQTMRKPAWVFDSRILLDSKKLKDIGFNLWTLGSP